MFVKSKTYFKDRMYNKKGEIIQKYGIYGA